ncbi:MAG: hypothetical protein A3G18_01685 [Rhodospirillales bacterium RIFCSPLOWO2_12_FULL_58_28]|nr:MAG: hypothetical protein A3G18_01685 [Rhodospirillales bacterium RIFCSPLOWO2_12_FULL_58_28]
MLELIRKRATGIVVKSFLGILILSFALWGIGDVVRGIATESEVATVGGVKISPESFNVELQREMNRLRSSLGDQQFDLEQAKALGVVDMVLANMVTKTLFSLGADDLGVAASDGVINDEIKRNPEFNGPLGKFDRFTFQQVLRNNGFSESGFIRMVRDNIKRSHLLDSVVGGGVAPVAMAEAIYNHRREKRVAETIELADAAMTGIAEPAEADLVVFHKENAALFTLPEYRKLIFISITADELVKDIAVADEEINEAFKNRQDEFSAAERRHLQQMVMADEETAERVHKLLVEGGDFVKTAKDVVGLDADTLEMGAFTHENIIAELADAVFQLPVEGFSKPVKSPLGWHVLRVTGIEPARRQTIDEVRAALSNTLAGEKAVDALFKLANQMEDELGGGATLEDVSSRMGLKLIAVDAIEATGKDAAGKPVEGLPSGSFLKVAFETAENTDSLLTEAGPNGYFILRVDKVTAPALKPLETVHGDVVKAWRAKQSGEASQKAAEAALKRLEGGVDFSAVAGELVVEVKTTAPFDRSTRGELPDVLVKELFAKKIGEYAIARSAKGYLLARLKDIQAVAAVADKEGVDKIRQELTQSMREDLLIQLSGALRDRYPVTVNSRAVDQLF